MRGCEAGEEVEGRQQRYWLVGGRGRGIKSVKEQIEFYCLYLLSISMADDVIFYIPYTVLKSKKAPAVILSHPSHVISYCMVSIER